MTGKHYIVKVYRTRSLWFSTEGMLASNSIFLIGVERSPPRAALTAELSMVLILFS